jgi:putative transposase
MARIARVVVPGLAPPCHQRGNRREPVFFEADHYCLHRRLAAAAAYQSGPIVRCPITSTWRAPADADGSRVIFAEARWHFTAAISIVSDGRAICSRVALARW